MAARPPWGQAASSARLPAAAAGGGGLGWPLPRGPEARAPSSLSMDDGRSHVPAAYAWQAMRGLDDALVPTARGGGARRRAGRRAPRCPSSLEKRARALGLSAAALARALPTVLPDLARSRLISPELGR